MVRTRTLTVTYVVTLACAVIAGATAPAASADHGVPYETAVLSQYLAIAQTHWGAPAPTCTGQDGESIPVHAVLYDDPDPEVSAMAELPGCRIWLDRGSWPAAPDEVDCTILAHEWGHLLGHGHSDDDQSLMYEAPFKGAPGCGVFGDEGVESPRRKSATPKRRRSNDRSVDDSRKRHRASKGRDGRRRTKGRGRRGVSMLSLRPRRRLQVIVRRTSSWTPASLR